MKETGKQDECKMAVQAQPDDDCELLPSSQSQSQSQTTETEDDNAEDDNTQKENERILFQPALEAPGAFPLSPSLSLSNHSNGTGGTKMLFEKLLIERLKSTSSSTVATSHTTAPPPQKTWSSVSVATTANRRLTRAPVTSISSVKATIVASTSTTSSSGITASAEYLVGSASSSSSINNDDETTMAALAKRCHAVPVAPVPVSTSQQTITSRTRTSVPSSPSAGNISEKHPASSSSSHGPSSSAKVVNTTTAAGSSVRILNGGIRTSVTSHSIGGSSSKSSSSTNLYTNEKLLISSQVVEPSRSRKHLLFDENEYRMDHARRGIALIINNKHFASHLGMPTRDGTDKDASNLEIALARLGFDIKLVSNRTAASMKDLLLQLARYDHSDSDCFLCVIMSHGEEGFVYGIDREINIDELVRPFQHNKTLVGKPKLFFIQACRGNSFMDPIGLVDSSPFDTNEQCVAKIPMQADFLIAYSTVSGYYSWRNSANGSWFIQALCEILNKHAHEYDLLKMLTLVNRRVAYFFKSNTDDPYMNNKRQIPCVLSMLTKEVYLQPRSRLSAKFIK